MLKKSFETIGTRFEITIWDQIGNDKFEEIVNKVFFICDEFDNKYSRFKPDSYIKKLANFVGEIGVDENNFELFEMLQIYRQLNILTKGQVNPLIGNVLSDYGYDEKYSLQEKENINQVYKFEEAIEMQDQPKKIIFKQKCLLDLGALGKGYLIDKIYKYLISEKLEKFLIDGSGDIRYFSKKNEEIVCGLEHPTDPTKIIGTLKINSGSLCASSLSRRAWQNKNKETIHHYFNPLTNNFENQENIIATFVYCENATFADALTTALFFAPPENLSPHFNFEYLITNNEMQIKKSNHFNSELF